MHIITPKNDPDVLGQRLLHLSVLARSMPPSWDSAADTCLLAGSQGEYIGKVLPGRGIALAEDLKNVGINRVIPGIFERSLLLRLYDRLRDERGAITTYDGMLAAKRTYKGMGDVLAFKGNFPSTNAIWACSHAIGGNPGAGSYTTFPGGAVMTKSSTNAMSGSLSNPTSPDKKYLISLGYGSAVTIPPVNVGILADLLVAAGAIDSNSNAAQTINSTALTRYTDGNGVMMGFEVEVGSLGGTPSNLTVTKYTNQAGTALQASPAHAMSTAAAASRMTPTTLGPFMQLATGDWGVRSIEEIQLSAAMGTAAKTLACHLFKPLCFMPICDGATFIERDFTEHIDGLVELVTDGSGVLGCLTCYINVGGSSASLSLSLGTING